MKITSLLLASLLGSCLNAVSGSGIRATEQQDADTAPPLEEVKLPDGAMIQWFEAGAGSGVLVATSYAPKGSVDPIAAFLNRDSTADGASIEGTKKSTLEALYVHVTGKAPSGSLLEALGRQKANAAGESARKGWKTPAAEEQSSAADTKAGEENNRQLCLNCGGSPSVGSRSWWVDVACRSTSPYDWCSCLPSRTGNGYKIKTSDDFFQSVYVYRGGIEHKIEYWSCATGTCKWTYHRSKYVGQGDRSTIWGEGGGSWSYKGSTVYGEGDGYHLSWYDQQDTDVGCDIAGLGGCYVCPSIA